METSSLFLDIVRFDVILQLLIEAVDVRDEFQKCAKPTR